MGIYVIAPISAQLDPGIIALLPDRPPQVTFTCDKLEGTCLFQFWVNRVESFYCGLDTCTSRVDRTYDSNTTVYECENIQCSCIPGRFICGENGSVGEFTILVHLMFSDTHGFCLHLDISEFLDTEIKGPGKYSCKTGSGCKFEEPGMNDLIDSIFGDTYITLKCNSGECLHYSQVPGYEVSIFVVFITSTV